MPSTTPHDAARSSLSDRRNSLRGPAHSKARLTLLDGPGAGNSHDVLTRDQPLVGVSFMLRDCLTVGQTCEIQFDGRGPKVLGEVVRARPISGGRYEMAVQVRKV